MWPSIWPSTPRPGVLRTRLAVAMDKADSRSALAMGCSEPASSAAAIAPTSASLRPSSGTTRRTERRPWVSVPVLSNTRSVACASVSRAWPRVVRRPRRVSRPVAVVRAAGVARPSAQGQVTTRTDTTIHNAFDGSITYQARPTARVISSSRPTNQAAARSASWPMRGFSLCARSSRRTIDASRVSAPSLSTRTTSGLAWLRLPPTTWARTPFDTGNDSPVSRASLTALSPSTTMPSAGRVSPGRTSTWSPTASRATGTCSSSRAGQFGRRVVAAGMSFTSSSTAAPARRRAFISRKRPVSSRKMNMVTES